MNGNFTEADFSEEARHRVGCVDSEGEPRTRQQVVDSEVTRQGGVLTRGVALVTTNDVLDLGSASVVPGRQPRQTHEGRADLAGL